ncbi:hypothetical protein O181_053111 [Austropuccinia psidii MF-1]|uniref:GPI ethanolamine phosphate transferase 2 n=1 Tax=Austropuccinia psidii MF-1 TaxID=1389203 RepID=A0A9Q3E6W5_9BASI|nr:hypothetical protein [Austropuccinia psidii MF-1]
MTNPQNIIDKSTSEDLIRTMDKLDKPRDAPWSGCLCWSRNNKLLIGLTLILQAVGAGLFARGFFPVYKPPSGYGKPPNLPQTPSEPFGKLVFVVIDALRSDFMFGNHSKMDFSQSLIRDGKALPYTALAQAPTVTLPRLKALTTGSNPQFLDAVLNLAESTDETAVLERTDTWLRQLLFLPYAQLEGSQTEPKKKALFYGDDTWLRLFPSRWFADFDGVTSFYVSDTEVVDLNVTRHLDHVLSDENLAKWDMLILHYLGLDHVGHLGGSKSALMGPKQQQLDQAIAQIFQRLSVHDAVSGQKSLLVVAGDHGMTDTGNHGGSSYDELSAALLLASPYFSKPQLAHNVGIKPELVQQLDIVPTLSILFGTGIPPASIGVAIESALDASFRIPTFNQTDHTRIEASLRNHAIQIVNVLQEAIGSSAAAKSLLQLDNGYMNETLATLMNDLPIEDVKAILRTSQRFLLSQFSGYSLPSMLSGLIILAIAAFSFSFQVFYKRYQATTTQEIVVLGFACTQLASFASTSFIEEEHEAWFFLGSSSFLLLASLSSGSTRFRYLLGSLMVRIFRSWSMNGQKASIDQSFASLLRREPWLSHLLDLPGLFLMIAKWVRIGKSGFYGAVATIVIAIAAIFTLTPMNQPFMYLNQDFPPFEKRELRPQATYLLLVCAIIISTMTKSKGIFVELARSSALLLSRSVIKRENYPILWLSFVGSLIQHSALLAGPTNPTYRDSKEKLPGHSIAFSWLQLVIFKCSFFAFGGSNSLATVDLSNAYNGLSSYSVPIVAFLTFLSNFAGPIMASLGFSESTGRNAGSYDFLHLSMYYACPILFCMGIWVSFIVKFNEDIGLHQQRAENIIFV